MQYIYLQQKEVAKTIELSDVVKIDLDEEGNLIGIEVLDATQRYSLADTTSAPKILFLTKDSRPKCLAQLQAPLSSLSRRLIVFLQFHPLAIILEPFAMHIQTRHIKYIA